MPYQRCTFAIFGDSYVSRLKSYTHGIMDIAACEFFGVPGMSTRRKCENEFDRLITARPRFVFMILGGNDIEDGCSTTEIFDRIMSNVVTLRDYGVERVFVSSIAERGSFLRRTGMTRTRYNQVRKSINKKLRGKLGPDYVDLGKWLRFPRHYDRDLIHPGNYEGGMRVLKFVIHRTFTKAFHQRQSLC